MADESRSRLTYELRSYVPAARPCQAVPIERESLDLGSGSDIDLNG